MPSSDNTTRKLLAHHRKMLLEESAISEEVVAGRGYWTAEEKSELRNLGFAPSQQLVPALVIPMYAPNGELISHQIRPDNPRENDEGKLVKYESLPGPGNVHLDVHPFMRERIKDPGQPMFVSEGGKTCDSATSQGMLTVMLQGVWCFDVPEWDEIPLLGRKVVIAFDSDAATNPHVHHAMRRFGTFLFTRGAEVRIWFLPPGPGGEKMGLDDHFAAGSTLKDILNTKELGRPIVVTNNRFNREITAEAVGIMHAQNDPPRHFMFGTELVRLRGDTTEVLSPDALSGILDRAADFVKTNEKLETKPSYPPMRVVKDILSLDRLPFPELKGIVRSPVYTAEGELLAEDGYHQRSGLLLHRDGLGPVRSDMSTEEAMAWLREELLVDFPFENEGAFAHALAMITQPFVRQMIEGATPLYLLDAPIRGTGKGLLTEVAAYIATGSPAPMMQPGREEETEKRITSLLLEGVQMVVLDNVESLYSSSLAAALTSLKWKGRRLGKSEMVQMENHALWAASGNNVNLSSEIARRTVPIRLDPQTERPELRGDFRHTNLRQWVREHRGELVSAALSLIGRWLDAGAPRDRATTIGSFEGWGEVMGGIMGVAGVEGLLSGREYLQEEASKEAAEWGLLCHAWWERYGNHPVAATDVLEVAREQELLLDLWGGRTPLGATQKLGHALGKKRDQRVGEFTIRSAGASAKSRNSAYRLEINTPGDGKNNPPNDKTTAKQPLQEGLDKGDPVVSVVSGVFSGAGFKNGLQGEKHEGSEAIKLSRGLYKVKPGKNKTTETTETTGNRLDTPDIGGRFSSEIHQNNRENNRRELTEEEVRQVRRLIQEGMSAQAARYEVLGGD